MKVRSAHYIGLIILLIAILITVAGVLVYTPKSNMTEVNLRLKWSHNTQFSGIYMALANNLYKNEGLTVTMEERLPNSPSAVNSVLNGSSQFAIISSLELLDSIAQGKKIQAIAAIYQESPSIIGSLTKNNIRTPTDLRGKTLGISGAGAFGQTLYTSLLTKAQVPINTVNYKNIGFSNIDSILDGTVDAASFYRTQADYKIKSQSKEMQYIKPEDYGIHLYDDVIIASSNFIQERPDLVKAFVQATITGWEQALDNPDKAVDIAMEYAHDEYHNKEYLRSILADSDALIRSGGNKIGGMNPKRWEAIYKLYTSTVVTTEFDVSKAYTLEFIQ